MSHQPCAAWLDDISAYLDGVLDMASEHRVHAHLRQCPACSEWLVDLVPVVKAMQLMPEPVPTSDPWPAIARSLASDARFRRRHWLPAPVRLMFSERKAAVGWAAAGVMFFAVGGMSYMSVMDAQRVPIADTDTYWHQHQLFTHEESVPTLYTPELRAIEASYQLDE